MCSEVVGELVKFCFDEHLLYEVNIIFLWFYAILAT